jgi:hypothetical protein
MAEEDVAAQSIESAEDLLGLDDLDIIDVQIKAWKGRVVHLRAPSAFDALELGKKVNALPKGQDSEALRLILMSLLVNAKGEKILTTDEHFKALNEKSAAALVEIQSAGMKMLGWSNIEAAKGKDALPETGRVSSPTA